MFMHAPDSAAMVDQMAKTTRLQRLLFGAEQAEAAGKLGHAQVLLEILASFSSILSVQLPTIAPCMHACMHEVEAALRLCRQSCILERMPGLTSRMDATQDLWLELRCFLAADAADNAVTAAHAASLLDTCGHRLTGLLSRVQPSQ